MRLMVYSHDTFGLGNIRRMLAICEHLLDAIPEFSTLLVSGSPMLQSFRLPQRLDYIKLPCLNRGEGGELSAKYLGTTIDETLKLRANLILSAAVSFKPDLILVDKKPQGLRGELESTLNCLQTYLTQTKLVLLLRDILDSPDTTIKEWQNGYSEAIQQFYDLVLVVGVPEVFDLRKEYQLPASVSQKVQFCGYIRKEFGLKRCSIIRQELQLAPKERLVLVTPGGGEDGYRLIDTYLSGLAWLPTGHNIRSLVICGPEMPPLQRKALYEAAEKYPHVWIHEFTDDLMSYMDAADTVVSMAGYNTVCEILSLRKRAVVVPRIKPSQEQWIRAERMAHLGLFTAIHPDHLTPQGLMYALLEELGSSSGHPPASQFDLDALPRITQEISTLLYGKSKLSKEAVA